MTTRYTVTDYNGAVVASGLTLSDAAAEVLRTDGREWEVCEDGEGFRLWSRHQVAGRRWERTVAFSLCEGRAEAEAEIFAEVIAAEWRGHYVATVEAKIDPATGFDRRDASPEAQSASVAACARILKES